MFSLTCPKCYKFPSRWNRFQGGKPDMGYRFCMKCAEDNASLREGDYDPEPPGFTEFVQTVIKGAQV